MIKEIVLGVVTQDAHGTPFVQRVCEREQDPRFVERLVN